MTSALRGRITRRTLTFFMAAAATAQVALPAIAQAQEFPSKGRTIRIIVGFTAGGGTDAQARIVAQKLGEVLGIPVVVENKPGASTMMAASEVARAVADGYTLLYAPSSTMVQNPHTLPQVPYDPFKDFSPISLAGRGPLVLTVNADLPVKDVKALIAYAKARPATFSYASFGAGTSSHIYGEAFVQQTGVDATHIPYKGGSDAAKDLMAGRVQYMFDSASSAVIAAATGRVRVLGVAAPRRIAAMPDVPTLAEQGIKGMDLMSWLGFYGPANLPAPTVAKLDQALRKVLAQPQVQEFFRTGGYEAESSTPEEFAQLTRTSYEEWGTLVRKVGLGK